MIYQYVYHLKKRGIVLFSNIDSVITIILMIYSNQRIPNNHAKSAITATNLYLVNSICSKLRESLPNSWL